MSITAISLICFVAFAGGVGTVFLLIRDLRMAAAPSGGVTIERPAGGRLRRTPTVFDEAAGGSVFRRFDQSFDRLVLESGWDINPTTAFLFLVACGLLLAGLVLNLTDNPLGAIVSFVGGVFCGLVILIVRRNRRMARIQDELPSVMDLMARAVRAGRSIDQAIALLGNECPGDLGKEFARCSGQLQMGRSLSAVMNSLAARVRLVDLKLVAMTLIVHRKSGGNLANTLERMSGVIRDRMSARRQMKAATGAGRASTLLIAVVSPLAYLVMFVFAQEHMEVLFTDPFGRMLLGVAIVLEIVGVLWVIGLLRQSS